MLLKVSGCVDPESVYIGAEVEGLALACVFLHNQRCYCRQEILRPMAARCTSAQTSPPLDSGQSRARASLIQSPYRQPKLHKQRAAHHQFFW